MNWLETFTPELTTRLVFTLLHFLWQGLLIGVFVAGLNALARQGSASLRYGVGFLSLMAMLTCLPVTFWCLASTEPGPVAIQADALQFTPPSIAPVLTGVADVSPPLKATHSVEVASDIVPTFVASPPEPAKNLESAAPYLIAVYLIGVAAMLLRLLLAFGGGERLRRSSALISDPQLLEILDAQVRHLGLSFVPPVRMCRRVTSPIIVGVLKPTILLPIALLAELTPAQIESVLTHELAHLRRWDHLANLLQRMVETVLFFHPAVWYVSATVSRERENCCDDLVLKSGADRSGYAEALLRVAELGQHHSCGQPATVLAADGGKPTQLRRRVLRVMNIESCANFRTSRWGLTLVLLALITAGIWPTSFTSNSISSTEVSPDEAGRLIEKLNQHATAFPSDSGVFSGTYSRNTGDGLSHAQINERLAKFEAERRTEIEIARNNPKQKQQWAEYLQGLREEARSNGRDSVLSDQQLIEELIRDSVRGFGPLSQTDQERRKAEVRAKIDAMHDDANLRDEWNAFLQELRAEAISDGRGALLSDQQLIEESIQESVRGLRHSLQIDNEERTTKYAFDFKFKGDLALHRYVTEQLVVDGKDAECIGLIQETLWGKTDHRSLMTSADGLSSVARFWDKPSPIVYSSENLDWRLKDAPFQAISYTSDMLLDSSRATLADGQRVVFLTLDAKTHMAIWRIGLLEDRDCRLHSLEIFNRTTGLPISKQYFSDYREINGGQSYPFKILETQVVTAEFPPIIADKIKAGDLSIGSRETLDAAQITKAATWNISLSKATLNSDIQDSDFKLEIPAGATVEDGRTQAGSEPSGKVMRVEER